MNESCHAHAHLYVCVAKGEPNIVTHTYKGEPNIATHTYIGFSLCHTHTDTHTYIGLYRIESVYFHATLCQIK